MPNLFIIPYMLETVIDHVGRVPDLLNCVCVNSLWNLSALKRLYRGCLNDKQNFTPILDPSTICLLHRMSFLTHLLLHPEKWGFAAHREKDLLLLMVRDKKISIYNQKVKMASNTPGLTIFLYDSSFGKSLAMSRTRWFTIELPISDRQTLRKRILDGLSDSRHFGTTILFKMLLPTGAVETITFSDYIGLSIRSNRAPKCHLGYIFSSKRSTT